MHYRHRLALIVAVVVIFVVVGGVCAIVRFAIRYNRSGAALEAREAAHRAAMEASRARRRRGVAELPQALPHETKVNTDGPALGNVVIKNATDLRTYERELVRVHVPTSSSRDGANAAAEGNCSVSAGLAALAEDSTALSAGQRSVASVPPCTSSAPLHTRVEEEVEAFQDDLERGGFVIVDCGRAPSSDPLETDPLSRSAAQRRETETVAPAQRHIQIFRHQPSSMVYGAATYYSNPAAA
ncbi:hypothetical protein NESM_000213300 [Novymonas esmeraldas]|uniref:Uncharacterized protein n=1 Tax=Novymonas esmeraldas TaxID=1808958 RepID=A0AAW0F9N1_9TRYP